MNIEYNEYPIPPILYKSMKRKYANELIKNGSIRLHDIIHYKQIENSEIGDKNEGDGLYKLNGRSMNSGTINRVYIWCLAIKCNNKSQMLNYSNGYDVIIKIDNPQVIFEKIKNALNKINFHPIIKCGVVNYDRGLSVDLKTLNNKIWSNNIFQKDKRYNHQDEYRLSVFDINNYYSNESNEKIFIDLEIGNCKDIISIS